MLQPFSSWVWKVLSVAKAHMSPGSVLAAADSAAFAAGVSLAFILQAGDWARVSTPARHYFSPISLLRIDSQGLCTACCVGP